MTSVSQTPCTLDYYHARAVDWIMITLILHLRVKLLFRSKLMVMVLQYGLAGMYLRGEGVGGL